jgi:group I intron endonuclease
MDTEKEKEVVTSGVYYIKNTLTQKGYIGSSKNINRRKSEHFRELRKNTHKNRHLQSAFNKYGESVFEFSVVVICPEEYIFKLEQWFLSNSNYNFEYNICKEVILPPKLIFTEELKLKMSKGSKIRANKKEEKLRLQSLVISNWKNPMHKKFMQELNKGEKHPQAKITEEIARKIKEELINTEDYYGKLQFISKKYNVTLGMVKSIKYEKSWKFIKI